MTEDLHKLSGLAIDAVPQRSNLNEKENIFKPKVPIERLVDGFSVEDYKSAFFLLMGYDDISPENFIRLTNQDLPDLKVKFIKICEKNFSDETIFIELFGTLKMFKKLKLLGTCFHVHCSQRNQFTLINEIWKVLYKLCEEMTDDDINTFKQTVPESSRNRIQSAEDWFCWALTENKFSSEDLSGLEIIFKGYPNCLNIIRSFKDLELYPMKVASSSSSCGIALILNYDKFNENTGLDQRYNSDKDVDALKELWKNFGFEIKYRHNLSCSDTLKEFKNCALADHSSFDAFVCCILSHGKSDSVYSSDGYLMEISTLMQPIMNSCKTLNSKPKLFFIQACQGTNIHQGPGSEIHRIETAETHPVKLCKSTSPPIIFDTLISKSTIDGYVSFRDDNGSWFFQTFCKIMGQYGDTDTIQNILMKVCNEISKLSANLKPLGGPTKALQMPEYISNLRKKLILKKRLK